MAKPMGALPPLPQPGAIPMHQLLQVTLMLDDGTVEPGPTDKDFNPTQVLGIGKYLGGTKHGIRQMTPDFHTVPLTWRVSVSQFHYEQGTILVQKLEIHSV